MLNPLQILPNPYLRGSLMDISLLNKSINSVTLGTLTFHYLRPSHTAMVQLEYEASDYLQAERSYSLARFDILEALKEEKGISNIKDLDSKEMEALDTEFFRRVQRAGLRLEVPAEDVLPIMQFVAAHLSDVEGLTSGGEKVSWKDLEEAIKLQVIDALDPKDIYSLYSLIKESVSLPLGAKRDSGNTLNLSTSESLVSAPNATPTGIVESASMETLPQQ